MDPVSGGNLLTGIRQRLDLDPPSRAERFSPPRGGVKSLKRPKEEYPRVRLALKRLHPAAFPPERPRRRVCPVTGVVFRLGTGDDNERQIGRRLMTD